MCDPGVKSVRFCIETLQLTVFMFRKLAEIFVWNGFIYEATFYPLLYFPDMGKITGYKTLLSGIIKSTVSEITRLRCKINK